MLNVTVSFFRFFRPKSQFENWGLSDVWSSDKNDGNMFLAYNSLYLFVLLWLTVIVVLLGSRKALLVEFLVFPVHLCAHEQPSRTPPPRISSLDQFFVSFQGLLRIWLNLLLLFCIPCNYLASHFETFNLHLEVC